MTQQMPCHPARQKPSMLYHLAHAASIERNKNICNPLP